MLRSITFIIFFLSLFVPSWGFSEEFLSGQVVEVNNKEMEFVIQCKEQQNNKVNEEKSENNKKILIRVAKKNVFVKKNGRLVFPECIKTGDQIRVWGAWGNNKQNILLAHDIKGCKGGGCSDPTGIMLRLKRLLGVSGKNIGKKRHGFRSGGRGPGSGGRGPGGHGHGGRGPGADGPGGGRGPGGGGHGGGGGGGNGGGGNGGDGK